MFSRYTIFLVFSGLLCVTTSFAQDVDLSKYRMSFDFRTIKQDDGSRMLEASFIARNKKDRKDRVPIFDAEIYFYNFLEEEEVLLGNSKTSKVGIASISLPENHNYLTDDSGTINLKAQFNETEALQEQEEILQIQDLVLELNLVEVDSIKMVIAKAYVIDSIDVETAVSEIDIVISVEGMLSKMPIGDGTIEDGEFEFEFPTDIPGDENGILTVYSIIEDNEEFGDVIQKQTISWGIFTRQNKGSKNSLWSEAAPIWMYVVLSLLLIGVWANYLYTIINLIQIKKEKQ